MNSPSDIPNLERLVKSLNSSLDETGTKLAIATAAVVLGLLIEYEENAKAVFWSLVTRIRTGSWERFRLLERHVKAAVLGGSLITVGVAAELWQEHQARITESKLEIANGRIIALLNEAAARAVKDARVADKRAGEANERAALLEKQAKTLEHSVAQAGVQAALAKRQAALANERTEHQKLLSLELEAQLAPRVAYWIRFNTKDNLDPLRPFTKQKVILQAVPDREAQTAASSIRSVLQQAGWNPAPVIETRADLFEGTWIAWHHEGDGDSLVPDNNESKQAAFAIAKFLESFNWKIEFVGFNMPGTHPWSKVPEGTVRVQVGFKPQPKITTPASREIDQKFREIQDEIRKQNDKQLPKK